MDTQIDDVYATSLFIKEKVKSHPVRIPVRGISMSPTIVSGQKVVLISKRPEDITGGATRLMYTKDRLVLHRTIYSEKVVDNVMFWRSM
jgi:hypothetical protein